jgi:hypothetical protein
MARKPQFDKALTQLTELFLYPIYKQAYDGHIEYADFRDLFFNAGTRVCSLGWARGYFNVNNIMIRQGTPIVVRWDSTQPHLVEFSVSSDTLEQTFTLTKESALLIMEKIRFKNGEHTTF